MQTSELTDTLNSRWKDDKSRFGYRMLQKMGWKDGSGLGKDESGSTSHIKVKKREENSGLGLEKLTDGAGNLGWNSTATAFNDVLAALKEAYRPDTSDENDKKKKKKKNKDKSKKSEKSSSDTIISVGIKYKKRLASKSLDGKSEDDLRAVLGVSVQKTKEVDEDDSSKAKKRSRKAYD